MDIKDIDFTLKTLGREHAKVSAREAEEAGYVVHRGLFKDDADELFLETKAVAKMFPAFTFRSRNASKKKLMSVHAVTMWIARNAAIPVVRACKGEIVLSVLYDEFTHDLDRLIADFASPSWSPHKNHSGQVGVRLPRFNLSGDGRAWYCSNHMEEFFTEFEQNPVLQAQCRSDDVPPVAYLLLEDFISDSVL